MSKKKARLASGAIVVLVLLLLADVVAIWPATLPWILGVFAVPGVLKFARTLFLWLTADTRERSYMDYAEGRDTI